MLKKRGQITVFIIIGLLVLLTYFVLTYYKKSTIEEPELIMPELIPVQQFVETCTQNIAEEAIDLIGINGGYIYFPTWIENDPGSYISTSPIKDIKNPYWWYDGKDAIPPLDFIGKQVSDYTKNSLAACINNFSAFHEKYEIIELGKFDVITEIGEEDVTIKTIYPIEVRDKFNKTLAELQKYIVIIPVRLKQVHEMAEKIIERDNKDFFIEKKAIDLISLDDQNIPTTGIEAKCGRKRWELSKIEKRLKDLLYINLPMIKIKGTSFDEDSRIVPYQLQDINPFSESNSYNDSYYYYHYIWDLGHSDPNMHISFSYDPMWDIKLYARPNKGRYIEANPQKAGKILQLFCLQIYHFTYDVVFPVKATIVDEKTEKNRRYSFTFAFKTQINQNKPDRKSLGIATFETQDTYLEEEYCSDLTNEIIINAIDQVTKDPINNVNLSFTCGRYTCNMGETKSDWDIAGIPRLKTRFPYCSSGVLRGTKPGYEEGQTFIQTGRDLSTPPESNLGGTFLLEMRPVKLFNHTVVKHKMIGSGVGPALSLKDGEIATIQVKNKQESFESYAAYPLEDNVPVKLLNRGQFKYDLEIFVMDNESISAGYKSDWTVTQVDLSFKNITFHVVEKDFVNEEDRFKFLAGLKEHSKLVPLPEIR